MLLTGTISVTSFQDSGIGSLRDAIEQANASAGADTIGFAEGGTIKLLSALPAVTDDLTITAAKKVTIDGLGKSAIFSVTGEGTDATFVGLTLTRGFSEEGGAAFLIDATDGVVEITNATITKMTSSGQDARGEAIFTLVESSVSGNLAIGGNGGNGGNGGAGGNALGAGIYTVEGAATTIETPNTIEDNSGIAGLGGKGGKGGAIGKGRKGDALNGASGDPGDPGAQDD